MTARSFKAVLFLMTPQLPVCREGCHLAALRNGSALCKAYDSKSSWSTYFKSKSHRSAAANLFSFRTYETLKDAMADLKPRGTCVERVDLIAKHFGALRGFDTTRYVSLGPELLTTAYRLYRGNDVTVLNRKAFYPVRWQDYWRIRGRVSDQQAEDLLQSAYTLHASQPLRSILGAGCRSGPSGVNARARTRSSRRGRFLHRRTGGTA